MTESFGLLRDGDERVSPVELFFDLVFVFAVTQLSHFLVAHPTWSGAGYAAVLLAMVWQVWVYSTWAINYLNPQRGAVRVLLLLLTFGSLVLAAELEAAFGHRGWAVAIAYVAMQLGRSLFMIVALRGEDLRMAFVRIACWNATSGVVVLAGAATHGGVRAGLWALAVVIDLLAAQNGFWVPGIGRSDTHDWTISGGHFAERCQAFVLIALGESIVVTGSQLADIESPSGVEIAAFAVAFATTAALWWIYFDRAADDSAEVIAASDDPGRIARNAFHWLHPLIVGGVIVGATADEVVLHDPDGHGTMRTGWLVLGGIALYLAGHALFKIVVWRRVTPGLVARLGGVVVCLALLPLAPHVAPLVLACLGLAVIVAVAVVDRVAVQ